jgi:YidC/Oxa1 family membrane protein insertase
MFNPFSSNFFLVPIFLNLLVWVYNLIPDIGVVIILLTLLIRLILAPSFHKSLKSQSAMTALQPKMNDIREKYKHDQQAQAKAMMDLYREHKINPFSSCLPLLIQLPILISLYFVFTKALSGNLGELYSFVHRPENLSPMFLGLLDLSNVIHLGLKRCHGRLAL